MNQYQSLQIVQYHKFNPFEKKKIEPKALPSDP